MGQLGFYDLDKRLEAISAKGDPLEALKLVRRYTETDASVHDSRKLDEVLDKSNTSNEVRADSAYRSTESEAKLKEQGYKSRIHRRGARNHPLSERQQAANTTRSRVA